MVKQERLLEEFCELVGITCNSRDEREVCDVLKQKLEAMGAEVCEDDAGKAIGGTSGNLFARFKGTVPAAPTIMFCAHMDCVVPCAGIEPEVKDGVIRSAGDTILGGDDKAGVAAILEAVRAVRENNVACGDLLVLFTVCEEGGLHGAKNVDRSLLAADFGYVLDADGKPGKIIVTAPGQNSMNIVVRGKTAHAGIEPENGVNAIIVAAKILAGVPQGRIDEETTCNFGSIHGGVATNIVPDRVEIQAEARSRSAEKLAALTEKMKTAFTEGGVDAEVIVTKAYEPYTLAADSPVVELVKASAAALGFPVELAGTGGGSDANIFNGLGLPCATLGIGMSNVHTTEEYLRVEDLYNSAVLVAEIIRKAPAAAR